MSRHVKNGVLLYYDLQTYFSRCVRLYRQEPNGRAYLHYQRWNDHRQTMSNKQTFVLHEGWTFLFTHQVRVTGGQAMLRRAQRSASVSHTLPFHAAVRKQDMPHAHGSHMDWSKT